MVRKSESLPRHDQRVTSQLYVSLPEQYIKKRLLMPGCGNKLYCIFIVDRPRLHCIFTKNLFLILARNLLTEIWGSALRNWDKQQESAWGREHRVRFWEDEEMQWGSGWDRGYAAGPFFEELGRWRCERTCLTGPTAVLPPVLGGEMV